MGNGPKIVLEDLDYLQKGYFSNEIPNTIVLNQKIVDAFELSFDKDFAILEIFLQIILQHEYIHYGRYKNQLISSGVEYGSYFEELFYGKTVNNFDDTENYINQYKENQKLDRRYNREQRNIYKIEDFIYD